MNSSCLKNAILSLVAGLLLPFGVSAAVTSTPWTGADTTDPTDLARDGNWQGDKVPELDTTATPKDGPFAVFGQSDTNYTLTLSRDLYLNGIKFDCLRSKFDIDLTGRTLKLYGYTGNKDGQQFMFRTNSDQPNDILVRGGTFDVTDHYVEKNDKGSITLDKYSYLSGDGSVAFSGTYFPAMTLFAVYYGTTLYLTNGVTGHVKVNTMGSRTKVPKIVISGKGTELDLQEDAINISTHETNAGGELYILDEAYLTNACIQIGTVGRNGYGIISNATVQVRPSGSKWIGAGINANASNNVLKIIGGTKLHMKDYTGKTQMYVGRLACSNTVEVSGEETFVDWSTEDTSLSVVTVGEAGNDNYFHVSDGATFGNGGLGFASIGAIAAGYIRGDSNRNTVRVDDGASYWVASQSIGDALWGRTKESVITSFRRYPDGTTYMKTVSAVSDADYTYTVTSNRFVASGVGTSVRVDNYTYVSGKENVYYHDNAAYNLFRVESQATAHGGLAVYVGKRGYKNGVEVDTGASLTVGKYGLNIGDSVASTGSYVRVSNAATLTVTRTAADNGYLSLLGSGEGDEALLDVTGGASVSANLISTTGARNAIRLENGSLTSTLDMTYPYDDTVTDALRFDIGGTNSSVTAGAMTFKPGVSFDFNLPTNGFVCTPFVATKTIAFTGVPTVSFVGLEAVADLGGGKFTLFEANTSLTADASVVAAFDAAAKAACARSRVELVDGKKLVLRVPSNLGLCIILR